MSSIEVISSDGISFNFTQEEIAFSKLLSRTVSDLTVITKLHLDQINSEILQKIQVFLRFSAHPPSLSSSTPHCISPETEDDIFLDVNLRNNSDWIIRFLNENIEFLGPLLEAGIFLEITSLTDIIATKIAEGIQKCETVEEIRSTFQIHNDLTSSNEQSIKKQISWVFSDSNN